MDEWRDEADYDRDTDFRMELDIKQSSNEAKEHHTALTAAYDDGSTTEPYPETEGEPSETDASYLDDLD